MNSVQFRGVPNCIKAFNECDGEGWAIMEGKILKFKGIGDESLKGMLENFYESASNSVYTLRVYESIDDRKKITVNTEYDSSFNFRLHCEEDERPNKYYITRSTARNDEIAQLREELRLLKEEKESDPQPNDLGMVGQIFTHPVLGNYAGMILGGILQNFIPGMRNMQPQQAAINGVPGMNAIAANGDAGQIKLSVDEIVIELQKHDPRIKQHLYKLLQIAIHNKSSFDFLTNTLDSM